MAAATVLSSADQIQKLVEQLGRPSRGALEDSVPDAGAARRCQQPLRQACREADQRVGQLAGLDRSIAPVQLGERLLQYRHPQLLPRLGVREHRQTAARQHRDEVVDRDEAVVAVVEEAHSVDSGSDVGAGKQRVQEQRLLRDD